MRDEILDFWFGQRDAPVLATPVPSGFAKTPRSMRRCVRALGSVVDAALAGGFAEWTAPARASRACSSSTSSRATAIATRARAFAGDALALSVARQAVARGDDLALIPVERWFLYMPFVHAESVHAQQQSVELFTRLATDTGLTDPMAWAERHAAVVRRFGRFPHRNAILGRASTPEEVAFLATPGSGF